MFSQQGADDPPNMFSQQGAGEPPNVFSQQGADDPPGVSSQRGAVSASIQRRKSGLPEAMGSATTQGQS